MMNNFDELNRIDAQCEMLSKQKMARHHQDILDGNYPKDDNLVPISDFGIYKCSIPILGSSTPTVGFGRRLVVGHMISHKTPTGEEFLEITPMDKIKQVAYELFEKIGNKIVLEEIFNSYQECRKNPDLISFEKMTPEEIQKDLQGKVLKNPYNKEEV